MSLMSLIVFVIVLSVVFWMLSQLPFAEPFKTILLVICAASFVYWILQNMGYIPFNLRLR